MKGDRMARGSSRRLRHVAVGVWFVVLLSGAPSIAALQVEPELPSPPDVLDTATETVADPLQAVDVVVEIVEHTLEGAAETLPALPAPVPALPPAPAPDRGETAEPPATPEPAEPSASSPSQPDEPALAEDLAVTPAAGPPTPDPAVVDAPEPELAAPQRPRAIEAASDFSLPLVISLVVIGFLIVRTLGDRRDPKFVAASAYRGDALLFS